MPVSPTVIPVFENVVIDARDPRRLGAFWRDALGAEVLSWGDDLVEMRVALPEDVWFDVCLPRVPDVHHDSSRVCLDLAGGADRRGRVADLRELGAHPLTVAPGAARGEALTDPEGTPFRVVEYRPEHEHTGPIAAIRMDSSDPRRDARFWEQLMGWQPHPGAVPTLTHPSGYGPILELHPEASPKDGKNPLHLDVRTPAGVTLAEAVARAEALGATPSPVESDLPWVVMTDPSGNELCVLAPVAS